MSIRVTCPSCNATSDAPDEFAGKRVKCRKCGASVGIPAVAAVADLGLDISRLTPVGANVFVPDADDSDPVSLIDGDDSDSRPAVVSRPMSPPVPQSPAGSTARVSLGSYCRRKPRPSRVAIQIFCWVLYFVGGLGVGLGCLWFFNAIVTDRPEGLMNAIIIIPSGFAMIVVSSLARVAVEIADNLADLREYSRADYLRAEGLDASGLLSETA